MAGVHLYCRRTQSRYPLTLPLLVHLGVPLDVPLDLLLGWVLSLLPSEGVDGAGVSSGATSA